LAEVFIRIPPAREKGKKKGGRKGKGKQRKEGGRDFVDNPVALAIAIRAFS